MRIESEIQLDFKDVLIRPKRSNAPSRRDVDLTRTFKTLHGNALTCVPIIAANMFAIGTVPMLGALAHFQMLTALHKFYTIPELLDIWESGINTGFYSLGIRDEDFTKLKEFILTGFILPNMVCLDAANGHTKYFVDRVKELRGMLAPDTIIIAGNTCIPEMTQELILAGADIVKLGIGPGAACTTRKMTGVGRPQLSTIIDCADCAHGLGGLVCADGGCKTPGDIAKAFGAGADFVMLGSMLAGTEESNGKLADGSYEFFGMSSEEAQERFYSGVPEYAVAEGQNLILPGRGHVVAIIKQILGGLRSACTYIGTDNLKDFSKCMTFVRTT